MQNKTLLCSFLVVTLLLLNCHHLQAQKKTPAEVMQALEGSWMLSPHKSIGIMSACGTCDTTAFRADMEHSAPAVLEIKGNIMHFKSEDHEEPREYKVLKLKKKERPCEDLQKLGASYGIVSYEKELPADDHMVLIWMNDDKICISDAGCHFILTRVK